MFLFTEHFTKAKAAFMTFEEAKRFAKHFEGKIRETCGIELKKSEYSIEEVDWNPHFHKWWEENA